jgi:hypothetical protein
VISGLAPVILTGTTGRADWHTSSATIGQALGGTAREILGVVFAYVVKAPDTKSADLEQALTCGPSLSIRTTDTARSEAAPTTRRQPIDFSWSDV